MLKRVYTDKAILCLFNIYIFNLRNVTEELVFWSFLFFTFTSFCAKRLLFSLTKGWMIRMFHRSVEKVA